MIHFKTLYVLFRSAKLAQILLIYIHHVEIMKYTRHGKTFKLQNKKHCHKRKLIVSDRMVSATDIHILIVKIVI